MIYLQSQSCSPAPKEADRNIRPSFRFLIFIIHKQILKENRFAPATIRLQKHLLVRSYDVAMGYHQRLQRLQQLASGTLLFCSARLLGKSRILFRARHQQDYGFLKPGLSQVDFRKKSTVSQSSTIGGCSALGLVGTEKSYDLPSQIFRSKFPNDFLKPTFLFHLPKFPLTFLGIIFLGRTLPGSNIYDDIKFFINAASRPLRFYSLQRSQATIGLDSSQLIRPINRPCLPILRAYLTLDGHSVRLSEVDLMTMDQ